MAGAAPSPHLPDDAPADPSEARRSNRSRVLRSIITRGPATRAELSRRIRLSRPTISAITAELLAAGVLSEGARVSSGGAPGTLLEVSKDTGVTVVADLREPGNVLLTTVSAAGEVLASQTATGLTGTEIHETVGGFVTREAPGSALGVALAVPGWVTADGEWAPNHVHDADPDLVRTLRREVRLPIFAINAVDAVAIADLRDSPTNLAAQASVVLDTRIGLGLIVGGRLRTGSHRPAGDIAHIAPGTPGPTCPDCGHSCLQQQVQPLVHDYSAAAVQRAATALGAVLAPIAGAVELEDVALNGFPAPVAEGLVAAVQAGLTGRMPGYQVPAVRMSLRGGEAVAVGAAAMTLHRILG